MELLVTKISVFITIFNPFIQIGLKISFFMPNISLFILYKKKHIFKPNCIKGLKMLMKTEFFLLTIAVFHESFKIMASKHP